MDCHVGSVRQFRPCSRWVEIQAELARQPSERRAHIAIVRTEAICYSPAGSLHCGKKGEGGIRLRSSL